MFVWFTGLDQGKLNCRPKNNHQVADVYLPDLVSVGGISVSQNNQAKLASSETARGQLYNRTPGRCLSPSGPETSNARVFVLAAAAACSKCKEVKQVTRQPIILEPSIDDKCQLCHDQLSCKDLSKNLSPYSCLLSLSYRLHGNPPRNDSSSFRFLYL